jgi:tetratricopeptide (TPR) repeat protein
VKVLSAFIPTSLSPYVEWIRRWRCVPVRPWIQGAEFYQKGDYARAAECYLQGLRAHPSSRARVNALLDLAHCLFRLHRFDEAEVYLRQVTASFPDIREGYVRLARLQLWLGYATEAVWTMRVCLNRIPQDPELVTLFIAAAVDSGGGAAVVQEAYALLGRLHYDTGGFPGLEVARARLELLDAASSDSREDLAKLASLDRGPFEAVVAFAEVLLSEGKLAYARHHLHRALAAAPEHPKVLRLLALSYMHEGAFFEPEYAVQLAVKACQVTAWRGIHELYILAQAFVAQGDKAAALMVATQAKKIAVRLIGGHPGVEKLERFLQSAAAESQL